MDRELFKILLIFLLIPFAPPELFSWQFLYCLVGVPVFCLLGITLFVRFHFGHWPK